MQQFENYIINYHYGKHEISINCEEQQFKKVINELSNEFVINKRELIYNDGGYDILEVIYYILNYWEEEEIIGSAAKRV